MNCEEIVDILLSITRLSRRQNFIKFSSNSNNVYLISMADKIPQPAKKRCKARNTKYFRDNFRSHIGFCKSTI